MDHPPKDHTTTTEPPSPGVIAVMLHGPEELEAMEHADRVHHREHVERSIVALVCQLDRVDRVEAGLLPNKPRKSDGIETRFIRRTGAKLDVEEVDFATNIECGFRSVMFTATSKTDRGDSVEIQACAGMGAPWLTFELTGTGRYFRVDVRDVVFGIISVLNAEAIIAAKDVDQ